MKTSFAVLSLILALILLTGCSLSAPMPAEGTAMPSGPEEIPATRETAIPVPPETVIPETRPEVLSRPHSILETMTLREKVGQLFLVRPDALELDRDPAEIDQSNSDQGVVAVTDRLLEGLEQYPVGGFILFARNIRDPEQVMQLNRQLTEACEIPPFLAVDEEGGLVARLAGNPSFELPLFSSAQDVCTFGSYPAAQDMGLTIGGYLADYGFNMDMAPDADVFTNPDNYVIGSRAFSSDPWEAAKCARAMADGLRFRGICPVFKHFPGHGNTSEDSHTQLAVSRRTLEELDDCEWIPFYQAEDTECIMVGHIALPEVTGNSVPATLSPQIVTELLRNQIGFQGLILTDSLAMGAITGAYGPAEAPLLALQAGCDVLLMPSSLPDAFDTIVQAVETGSFPEEKLNETVLKILTFKEAYHLF